MSSDLERDLSSAAVSVRSIPPVVFVWLLGLATLAGAAAVVQPLAGIALALIALAAALLRNTPVRRLGWAAVPLTAVAAIVGPNLAVPGVPWLFAFRILIVGLGLGLVGYILIGGRLPVVAGLGRPVLLISVWVLWSALSILWARDTVAAARWTLFLAMMAGMACAIGIAGRSSHGLTRIFKVLGATFCLAIAIAMAELVLGVRLPTSALLGQDRQVAFGATSLFGNQNNFATFLTLSLPYFLLLPVVSRDIRLRILGVGGTLAALGALLYTGSKSNLLALGIVLLGLVALTAGDRRGRGRVIGAVAVAVVSLVVVVPAVTGGGGLIKLPTRALDKFSFSTLSGQVNSDTGSGGVRSSLQLDGLNLFVESGGLGVGAGNAESEVAALPNAPPVPNLHNWWLEVLVNGGVIGFACWFALYLYLVSRCLRVGWRARDPFVKYLGFAGALSLLGFIAGGLAPSTSIHFGPLWIAVGLAMAAVAVGHRTLGSR